MMKSFKARLDNENLITLVEEHPNLYNPFLKNYRNKNIRYLTWQKIAGTLGVDTEFCQRRWRTLRDRYKKEKSGTYVNKHNKPWEYASHMSFLDKMYQEHSNSLPWKKSLPVIQPITNQPVIITVPPKRGLRPIAPKKDESTSSEHNKSLELMSDSGNKDSATENESEEPVQQEQEIYLVTPTLFNEQERTLFKKSLNVPKRKATFEDEDEEVGTKAKRAAMAENALLRRQEFEYRLKWEEKEHFLRVRCQEEEHKIKMQVEQAKLKVEDENLRVKEQKFKVLLAKEAYFKSLTKSDIDD